MLNLEFGVIQSWLCSEDLAELEVERTRGVHATGAWLVAFQAFNCRVEIFVTIDMLQDAHCPHRRGKGNLL